MNKKAEKFWLKVEFHWQQNKQFCINYTAPIQIDTSIKYGKQLRRNTFQLGDRF